jgi:hypothetical protein
MKAESRLGGRFGNYLPSAGNRLVNSVGSVKFGLRSHQTAIGTQLFFTREAGGQLG